MKKNFNDLYIDIKFGITDQLRTLFERKPELFEEIVLQNYTTKPFLEDLDEKLLSEDGKAGWISVDNEQEDRMITYRFYWKNICNEL